MRRPRLAAAARPLGLALAFFTIVPVRIPALRDGELGRALAWVPLVGGALGAVLALEAAVLGGRLPAPALGVVLVATLAAFTGGLHLDGLADVFDGLGGARGDRERALRIMRDSAVGALGALALVLAVLLKAALVADVVLAGRLEVLVVGPGVARLAVVPVAARLPCARAEGLARSFHAEVGTREVVHATVLTALLVAIGGGWIAAAVAVGAGVGFAAWVSRRLGGVTGDVHGAAIELAELAYLLVAC